MKKLAIIAPQIGARSETFIQRHMDELAPGRTVVLARTDKPPYAGHWHSKNPSRILNRYLPSPWGLIQTYYGKLTGKKKFLKPFYFHRVYAIREFLKKNCVGVLMGEYLDYTHSFIELADKMGIPLWAHAHGYDISQTLLKEEWRQKYLDYNHSAGVITMNQISRIRLIELGIQAHKVYVVPYGVNVPSTCPKHSEKSGGIVRCLAVGRMVRKKAPILLLQAFYRAIRMYPDLHLDFIGEGELMDDVNAFIIKHQLTDQIILHGGQPNERVHELMLEADIFLQHSVVDPETGDEEGMPVAILEAMAHGLPIVSTRHAGIPEAVIEDHSGLLVNEGDIDMMAECILKLVNDPDKRKKMGLAAWKRAKDNFSWQRERADLLKLLGMNL